MEAAALLLCGGACWRGVPVLLLLLLLPSALSHESPEIVVPPLRHGGRGRPFCAQPRMLGARRLPWMQNKMRRNSGMEVPCRACHPIALLENRIVAAAEKAL